MTKNHDPCGEKRRDSARRPSHLALGKQMHVQVWDGLGGVRAIVNDETETPRETEFFCHRARGEEQMAEHGLVGRRGFADARDGLFRNDQEVNGRLRLDVVEDDAEFILVLDLRGDFAVDDFLEEGL